MTSINLPKKIILMLLGIAASVGYASLIVTPLQVPLSKQGDEFSHDVYLYRILGTLPSHNFEAELMTSCGLGLTEKQIQADQQALKECDAHVIAEAKRQEPRETVL